MPSHLAGAPPEEERARSLFFLFLTPPKGREKRKWRTGCAPVPPLDKRRRVSPDRRSRMLNVKIIKNTRLLAREQFSPRFAGEPPPLARRQCIARVLHFIRCAMCSFEEFSFDNDCSHSQRRFSLSLSLLASLLIFPPLSLLMPVRCPLAPLVPVSLHSSFFSPPYFPSHYTLLN